MNTKMGTKSARDIFGMEYSITNVDRNAWICDTLHFEYTYINDFTKRFDMGKNWVPLHLPGGSISLFSGDNTYIYNVPQEYKVCGPDISISLHLKGPFAEWQSSLPQNLKDSPHTADLVKEISDTLLYIHYMNWKTFINHFLGTNQNTNTPLLSTKRFNRFFEAINMEGFNMNYLKDHPYTILPYVDDFTDADKIEVYLKTSVNTRLYHLIEWVCGCITVNNNDSGSASSYTPRSKLDFAVRYKLKTIKDEEMTDRFTEIREGLTYPDGIKKFVLKNDVEKKEDMVSLYSAWNNEHNVFAKLFALTPDTEVHKYTITIPDQFKQLLTKEQQQIVNAVFAKRVVVVNGYPGTGKTTLTRAIVDIATQQLGLKLCLISPTGKAAKVLSKATNHPAFTIHKMLYHNSKIRKRFDEIDRMLSGRNAQEEKDRLLKSTFMPVPLFQNVDIFIMDESSMINMQLLNDLLKFVTFRQKIVMIGDVDQLPPIDHGSPFRDVVMYGKENCSLSKFMLTKIHRQDKHSNIIPFAIDIIHGKPLNLELISDKEGDIEYYNINHPQDIVKTLLNVVKRCKKNEESFQVIIPTRKSALGTERLNELLIPVINPNHKQGNGLYQVGDRIIFVKNEQEVCNGDIAIIQKISSVSQWTICLEHDESVITINPNNYNFEHAHCITVHKSQGSEYDICVVVLHEQFSPMLLQRKLLYTAVTRAKKRLVLIGTPALIRQCIKTNQSENSESVLKLLLTDNL